MKRSLPLLAMIVVLALASTGCPSIYSHIHKVDDNNYYLTRIKNGQSTLFLCSPMGQTADLRCVEIATTSP